jgi:hypothetical protein
MAPCLHLVHVPACFSERSEKLEPQLVPPRPPSPHMPLEDGDVFVTACMCVCMSLDAGAAPLTAEGLLNLS